MKDAALRVPPHVILWMYTHPHTLFLLEPGRGDTLTTVEEFIWNNYSTRVLPSALKILNLDTYKIRDVENEIKSPYTVLFVPQFKYDVLIEPSEGANFHVDVNLTDSVDDLKYRILKARGFPLNQQDLHLNGHVMENHVRLFEYDLHNRGKVKLQVQPGIPFILHVNTLWGKKYNIHVYPCTTTLDLLCLVLQRMHSAHHQTTYSYKHYRQLIMSHELKRWLILEHNGEKLEFDDLLNFHNITNGSTVTLRAFTDKYSADDRQTIRIFRSNGDIYNVKCTKYDLWLMVTLKVHAVTSIPLDALRLYHFGSALVTSNPIGIFASSKAHVDLVDIRPKWQQNDENWQQISVQLPSGLVEIIYCKLQDTISTIKTYLERRGVANGIYYDLYNETSRLLNNALIYQITFDSLKPLIMVLQTFPIQVIGGGGTTKITVQGHTELSTLLIHTSFPSHRDQSRVIFLGEELTQKDMTLSQTSVSANTILFTILSNNVPYIKIISSDERRTFPFTSKPHRFKIQEAIEQLSRVDDTTKQSLVKFLLWRFSNSDTNKYMISNYPRWLLKESHINVFIPELKDKPPIEIMDMDFDAGVPGPSMKPVKFYEAKPFNIKEYQRMRRKKELERRPTTVQPLEIDPKASILRQRPTIQTQIMNLPTFDVTAVRKEAADFEEWDNRNLNVKSYLASYMSPPRSVTRSEHSSRLSQSKDGSRLAREDDDDDNFESPLDSLRPKSKSQQSVQNNKDAFRNSRCVEIYPVPDDLVVRDEDRPVKPIRVTFADNNVRPFGRYRQGAQTPKKWAELDKEIFAPDKVWSKDDPVWQRKKDDF